MLSTVSVNSALTKFLFSSIVAYIVSVYSSGKALLYHFQIDTYSKLDYFIYYYLFVSNEWVYNSTKHNYFIFEK